MLKFLINIFKKTPPIKESFGDSFIGGSTKIIGDISAPHGNIRIEGSVFGNITSNKIIVSSTGSVHGGLKGVELINDGEIKGTLVFNNVLLTKNSTSYTQMKTKKIAIEYGANWEGISRMNLNVQ
tara:strand:+ start:2178 stop:2552 length:375 start_codon:yes stop_codon:yes gene_type:complete